MCDNKGVMMQFFHWYTPCDGSLWNEFANQADLLAQAGITSIWLPPAYKGAGGDKDTGYGVYDLFDLGEFDQKGSIRTKYGTRDEYLRAIQAAHDAGLEVYADIVFNHKQGGDNEEEFNAVPYNPENRNQAIGELQPIKAWTNFTFPGRGTKYSSLQWHWHHFNAVDTNTADPKNHPAVYLFEGKTFNNHVDKEKGNFDYLMGCNLDVADPDVRRELMYWGEWYANLTNVDGFRFDAVKHVGADFFMEWLNYVQSRRGRKYFALAEYWSEMDQELEYFIKITQGNVMLFDSALHYNFADAGNQKSTYDLRTIFDRSLVKDRPELAVTIVSNHDTQPLQSLESIVEDWFAPLAYALILLRQAGYPCIFYLDYYGAEYSGTGKDGIEYNIKMPGHKWLIDRFLWARHTHLSGGQKDYFDQPDCIGWTFTGTPEHPGGAAVLISNNKDCSKVMNTSNPNLMYIDITEHIKERVTSNEEGWAEFRCRGESVSVWVPADKNQ
jgi:alpha-amylase